MKIKKSTKYQNKIILLALFIFVVAVTFKLALNQILIPASENTKTARTALITTKDFISDSAAIWNQNLFVIDYRNNLFLITPKQELIQLTKDKQVSYLQQSKDHTAAVWIEFDECFEKNYLNFECPSRVGLIKASDPQKKYFLLEDSSTKKTNSELYGGSHNVSFADDLSKLMINRTSSKQDIYKITTDGTTVFESTTINPMPPVILSDVGGAYRDYVNPIYSPDKNYILYLEQLYEGSKHIVFDVKSNSIKQTIDSNTYGQMTGIATTPMAWIDSENLLLSECDVEHAMLCNYKSFSIHTGESTPLDFNSVILQTLERNNELDGGNYFIRIVKSDTSETYELVKYSVTSQNQQTLSKFPGRSYCTDCVNENSEMIAPHIIGLTQDKKYLLLQASIFIQNSTLSHQYDSILAIPVEDPSKVYQIAVVKE